MSCNDEYKDLASSYVLEELDEEETRKIEAHLKLCKECRRIVFVESSILDNKELFKPAFDLLEKKLLAIDIFSISLSYSQNNLNFLNSTGDRVFPNREGLRSEDVLEKTSPIIVTKEIKGIFIDVCIEWIKSSLCSITISLSKGQKDLDDVAIVIENELLTDSIIGKTISGEFNFRCLIKGSYIVSFKQNGKSIGKVQLTFIKE